MAESVDSKKHWADLGEYTLEYGLLFLIYVYRFGGRVVFRICLAPVIVFYYLFSARARRSVKQYLLRLNATYPACPDATHANGLRIFWAFGTAIIDKFAVHMGHIKRQDVKIYQEDLIDRQLQRGQGAVIVLSHLGNFEICQAHSEGHNQQFGETKLTVLVHTRHAEKFNSLLAKFSDHSNVELVQVGELGVADAIKFSERVQRGEFLAIAGDRVSISGRGAIDGDFLGDTAAFPSGPFVLATALKVPLLMLTCIFRDGQYHIYFEELAPAQSLSRKQRKAHFQQLCDRYAKRLEHYVQLAPYQWFNFFDFWRSSEQLSEQQSQQPASNF